MVEKKSFGNSGNISTRAIDRYAYAHDASHFLLVPEAVVIAKDSKDVARLLAGCSESDIPITFRSGGTSLSGQAVSDSVLVDVRRNFRQIEVLDLGRKVRVQPGATLRQVNQKLAKYGRKLGPDPASEVACTIGGVIANNSSGMSCGTTTNTYKTLHSMVVVLPNGWVFDTSVPDSDAYMQYHQPDLYRGLLSLRDRIRSNSSSINIVRKQFSMKNTMGYGLNSFLDYDSATEILAHLVIGSEGTLGFVAEAVFNTVPSYKFASTGLFIFKNLYAANEALPALVETGAAAIELMDAASLRVGKNIGSPPREIKDLVVGDQAALLIEYQGPTGEELSELCSQALDRFERLGLTHQGFLTTDQERRDGLWHLRKGLYATVAQARPSGTTALLEDVAVPVESLAQTCVELNVLFNKYRYENSVIFGHAKDGNIHFMLTDSFADAEPLERYALFTEDMVDLILGHSGSLKAEHGTGRVMAPYVRRQFGDELYSVMVEIKHLLDPGNILSPGVIISDDAKSHLRNIKTAPTIEPEVDRCVECGYCEPVCPSRDLTLTPRQRIVVRRAIRTAELNGDRGLVGELERDYTYSAVETCAVDGMCETSCPVSINTGDLIKRLRADSHKSWEMRTWTTLAKNWAIATRVASSALSISSSVPAGPLQRANQFGRSIIGEESLPLWSSDLPKGGKSRRTKTNPKAPQAVYIPACVNSMFAPAQSGTGVQSALESICARVGIELLVPANIDSLCCGTPWNSKGLPAGGQIIGKKLLSTLREATNNGQLPVICDASSCTEGIVNLLRKEEDSNQAEIRVIDAVEFVSSNVLDRLPNHRRLSSLTLHPTCSSTRLGINSTLSKIASHVAEVVHIPDDWGCCAFAGDRGMLHPELTASATQGQAREVIAFDDVAHASCNRTCELGMARAIGRPYRHLLELLEEVTRA